MNVSCNKCGKRYVIPDDRVAGKTSVKIRCKQCQNLVSVAVSLGGDEPAAAPARARAAPPPRAPTWDDESTRAMPAMDMSPVWFAMIQGKQEGPFGLKDLGDRVKSGTVTLRTYLWKQGMDGWKRASDVADVSAVFAGVSVGATATGPTRAAPGVQTRRSANDVSVGNETPALAEPKRVPTRSGFKKAPEPEPAPAPAPAPRQTNARPLDDLFNDLSGEHKVPAGVRGEPAGEQPAQADEQPLDPFAQLSEGDGVQAPAIGEATRFFIAQAGVNKRNPPWKIALFVLLLIGGPIAVLYTLSELHVVPLTVTRTTETGEVVEEQFFSAGGISGVKDLLSGEAKKKAAEAERLKQQRLAKQQAAALAAKGTGPVAEIPIDKPPPTQVQSADLTAFYGEDTGKTTRVPKVRKDGEAAAVNSAGLSQEAASKVVADKMKAFESCIEQGLRRNPNMQVGNITLVLTVGYSGAVKGARVEPRKFEGSDWALCMVTASKRIVFPSSEGETELQLPFKVGVAAN